VSARPTAWTYTRIAAGTKGAAVCDSPIVLDSLAQHQQPKFRNLVTQSAGFRAIVRLVSFTIALIGLHSANNRGLIDQSSLQG